MGYVENGDGAIMIIKTPSGIAGFDSITGGGLPKGRSTLVSGGPGAGKTIFAMQSLVHGARQQGDPGLLLTFEERPEDLLANFRGFDWDIDQLVADGMLMVIDARLSAGAFISGHFDISGLLAGVSARAVRMGAKRVAFDGLDVLLSLLDDPREEMRQLFEIDRWLRDSGLTGLITGKLDAGMPGHSRRADMVQYVVDCVVTLDQRVENRVATRDLRVMKYRGSDFPGNRYPVVIASQGIEVFYDGQGEMVHKISTRKQSSGVPRLDSMLGGGHFQGSSILISGAPGTAKTTLAGAMADSICSSGERALFISFDESSGQIARNLASVGIDLERHLQSGTLEMMGLRATAISAESHVHRIYQRVAAFGPALLVIDPVSALIKGGWKMVVDVVVQGILDFAKTRGVTTLITSLADGDAPEKEVTDTHVSTMADTWIHLSYVPHGGERNRALTIVKSRGSAHSNQVRELVLGAQGPTLADVYLSGGDVLMGTARLEREAQDREAAAAAARDLARSRAEVDARIAELQTRKASLESELVLCQAEAEQLVNTAEAMRNDDIARRRSIQVSRLADTDTASPLPSQRPFGGR